MTADGLSLYFAVTQTDDVAIYRSTRTSRALPFEAAQPVTELNGLTGREATPFINAMGTRLYFARQSAVDQTSRDLWVAGRSSATGPFDAPTALIALNGMGRDHLPWLPEDEMTIYFTSARSADNGATDIWRAARTSPLGPFGPPASMPGLSGATSEDGSPSLSPDGLTIYLTSGEDTVVDFEIYSATRATVAAPFGPLAPEAVLNSSANEATARLSPDGTEMYFSSDRTGSSELWVARRSCP